jgi:23S rRNA (adenine2503-C2)-methyltransferase
MSIQRQDIKGLNLQELKSVVRSWQVPEFHARQVWQWLYGKGTVEFSHMSDIPEKVRRQLEEHFFLSGIGTEKRQVSIDGTEKFLFRLTDGQCIEAVVIPTATRVTGCISSQVGCKFSCRFCASGRKGLVRNLSCAEILDEVVSLKRESSPHRLTHIVFMGTGEPFDNYENVLKAIRVINAPEGVNIAARRITISTCGVIPGIKRLTQEGLQVELSISLHAPSDALRSQLVPANKKYPLKELIAVCDEYSRVTNRQVTFEYVLIKGVNSSLQDARELVRIMKKVRLSKVNLIPVNAVSGKGIEPPNKLDVFFFRDYVLKEGIPVTLRRPRGGDIDAACGQLGLRYEKK